MKSTKQLAKELGFIRKRSASTGPKLARGTNQIFQYLIVLDFESTCWKDSKYRTQEINLKTGSVESEFHYYVQPMENPILSDFCKELTGISQEQVDNGIPLNLCLSKFSKWLQKLVLEKDIVFEGNYTGPKNRCAVVTWSDWDLGVCLLYECRRKQLKKPAAFENWIDLRATYRKFYQRKPQGLNGALQDLGINFEGRQHCGLDDARNTAKLAWRMVRDGCVMQLTRYSGGVPLNKQQQTGSIKAFVTPKLSHIGAKTASVNNGGGSSASATMGIPGNVPPSCLENACTKLRRNTFSSYTCATTEKRQNSCEPGLSKAHVSKVRGFCDVTNTWVMQPFKKPKVTPDRNIRCDSTKEDSNDCSLMSSGMMVEHRSNWSKMSSTSSTTPTNIPNRILTSLSNASGTNRTPPMCGCGRRSHRKVVQTPGPNIGRTFFVCPLGKRGMTNRKSGCGFFKWDDAKNNYASPVLNGYQAYRHSTLTTSKTYSLIRTPEQPKFI